MGQLTQTYDLICSWLGLPEGCWPPDHYRLLGLQPGESDAALIEQRVQQRLDAVRRYQMMHPEQATEAMNRLAQAFVCLTEPECKRDYDANVLGLQVAVKPTAAGLADTVVQSSDTIQTTTNPAVRPAPPPLPGKPPPLPVKPPPLPLAAEPPGPRVAPLPPLPAADPTPTLVMTVAPTAVNTPAVPLERIDPIKEAACCARARRGLTTRRALRRRLLITRRLLSLWNQVGKYVASPLRRLKRVSAAEELDRELAAIVELLPRFPTGLGQAGQPGYLVASLASQHILETFQTLDLNQRTALSMDWEAGRDLLHAHRDWISREARALRRQPLIQQLTRRVVTLFRDQPGLILAFLALLAVNVAIWRYFH